MFFCAQDISRPVILRLSRRIFSFRADVHFLHPPPRGCEMPVSIHVPCMTHLRQICGFAGLWILLSSVLGTPLSSLVGRKLQRSTRRRGEKNLPALRSTPLRARRRRSARAPNEMFRAENMGSVSDETQKRFFGLRPQNDRKRQCMSFHVILRLSRRSFSPFHTDTYSQKSNTPSAL